MCLGADRWEADGRGWYMGQAAASALTPEATDAERGRGQTNALGGQPVKAVPHLRGGQENYTGTLLQSGHSIALVSDTALCAALPFGRRETGEAELPVTRSPGPAPHSLSLVLGSVRVGTSVKEGSLPNEKEPLERPVP